MQSSQAITSPHGITVFGTALCDTVPDTALLRVTVSRLEQSPGDAFAAARAGSQAVQECLRMSGISEYGASRISLSQEWEYGSPRKSLGYKTTVSFQAKLTDLDRTGDILTALIAAGANEVDDVTFETSRLKELRAEARKNALADAFERARHYSASAGVILGPLLHIEEAQSSDPLDDMFCARFGSTDDKPSRTFEPGVISVSASVIVAFAIKTAGGIEKKDRRP